MKKYALALASAGFLIATPALAETPSYTLTLKNHVFEPANIEIPADTKVKLIIKNTDSTPAEFESHSLGREKVISGNSDGVVFIGPLKAGEYTFEDEFNPKTAQGKVIVKSNP